MDSARGIDDVSVRNSDLPQGNEHHVRGVVLRYWPR